jgi:WXG100 family type VII secretion target
MSGQIRMTPEQMRTRANEVRSNGDTFEGVINSMQNIINELQTEWEGAASQAFEQQFEALKPSFVKMRELIADIGTQLNQTADAVEALDNEIASKFQI